MADFKEDANKTYIEAELCPGVIEKWIKFTNEGDETMKGNLKKSAFALAVKKHLSALGWVFSYTKKNGGRREMRYMSPQGKWFFSLVKACMSCVEDSRVHKDEVSCFLSNVSSSVRVFGNRKLVKVNEEGDEVDCSPRVRVCGNGGNRELVKVSCASRDLCSGFEAKKERKRVRVCVNGRIRKLVKVNEEEDRVSCPPSDSDSDFEVKKGRKRVRVCVNGGNRKLVRVNEEGLSCAPRDLCSGFESKRIRVCDDGGSEKLSSAPSNLCSDSEVEKEKEKVRVCDNGGNQELVKVNEEDGFSSPPRDLCSGFEVQKEKDKVRVCDNGGNQELVLKVNEEEDGSSSPPKNLCSESEVKKEKDKVRVCGNGENQELVKVNEEDDVFSSPPRNICSDLESKKEKEKIRVCGNGGNNQELVVKVNEGEDGLLSCVPSNVSSGFNGVQICKSLKQILESLEKKSITEKNKESLRLLRRGCNGNGNGNDHDDDVVVNSEFCSVCYWGGGLLLCDGCPSSYHHTCLGLKTLPKEDLWFCPCCCCKTCGTMEFNHSKLMTCEQCNQRFHLKCLKEDQSCISCNGWFCSNQCEQVYSSLQKLIGHEITVGDDDLVWTLLRAPSGYVYDEPYDEQHMVMLRSAVKVLHEGFEPSKDLFSGRDLVEELVLRRDEDCVKHQGFYTVLVKRKKRVISVATIRVGKDVAEIPLVATTTKYRKHGMCRVLMNELEKQMIKMGVCELVLPAADAVLTTWTERFGFSEMTSDERLKKVKHGILDFSGTVLCRKSLSNGDFSVESSLTE